MTQSPSVIYLPPGVIPAASTQAPAQPTPGIPFDRAFFERLLPEAVKVFCQHVGCEGPRVEVFAVDGSIHYVNAISGVTDSFVALQTSREDHEHTMQVFLPYQTIFRVEIHPSEDGRKRLGFDVDATVPPPAIQPESAGRSARSSRSRRAAAHQP